MKKLNPIAIIDIKEIQGYHDYMHANKALKALERHIKRIMKHKAPNTGVVLVSRDIMNRII